MYFTEHPDGTRARLLVDCGRPVHEEQGLEAMACHIDVLKFDGAVS